MIDFDWQRYMTRSTHGPFPAGTECWVARIDDVITLKYNDCSVIELGLNWYLEGLEPRPYYSILDSLYDAIRLDIDREILKEILNQAKGD